MLLAATTASATTRRAASALAVGLTTRVLKHPGLKKPSQGQGRPGAAIPPTLVPARPSCSIPFCDCCNSGRGQPDFPPGVAETETRHCAGPGPSVGPRLREAANPSGSQKNPRRGFISGAVVKPRRPRSFLARQQPTRTASATALERLSTKRLQRRRRRALARAGAAVRFLHREPRCLRRLTTAPRLLVFFATLASFCSSIAF